MACIKSFDPFRGWFLYLFDELRLGIGSRQRGDDVNVIRNTAHAQDFATQIAADRRQISVYAGSDEGVEPGARDSSY